MSDRPRPRYFTVIWVLLLVLGAFFLFAVASDLAANARTGIPADHAGTFKSVAGVHWDTANNRYPGLTQCITLLEVAYAFHELTFTLLFIVNLAIPFRRGYRWAWRACWAVKIANLAYLLTFGRHDSTIFVRALVATIALPVLLLASAPWFVGSGRVQQSG